MAEKQRALVTVNRSQQPDGTHGLSVSWTGLTEDQREDLLAELAEHFEWPTDEQDITPLGRG